MLRFGPAGDLKVDLSNPLARLPARVGLVVRLVPAVAPSLLLLLVERVLPLLNVLFIFLVIFSPVRLPWLFCGVFPPQPVTVSILVATVANNILLRFTNAPPQISNPPEKSIRLP